ncbi:MAG: alpha-L-fucosidase [Acidobacteriaceae bacterium]|nr:alpha-L-fucosidase [Acidobacteriaceae bacterium]MBV9222529.1 alpha-L-fucosidase [Acidobacteriaceae bacterium]MBV9304558.1 alpha-L-fucosidase [Acidobacteriaceae bacterium]MBV9679287.1 alpha-L-fucosidase [Acidobacteriaceae bacterium]MBV9938971.1 alpha-L-fucosidase [Acidobacteriaceae bacterium]
MGRKTLLSLGVLALAAGQAPNTDDLLWQKSIGKFDLRRNSMLQQVDNEAHEGPFQPTWDSLKTYKVPSWYQDAKFGIFIHWGVYSVPAFGSEWYPRNMYLQGTKEFKHHVDTFGPQSRFGYKDFIPNFKAENFDARQWAELFRKSGAKYIVPVAEHHDGFAMYESELSDWNAKKMGPKRDIVGELAKAVRGEGLHFGASSHRAEHYFFMNGGREFDSDVRDLQYAAFYGPAHAGVTDKNGQKWAAHPDAAYLNDWLARTAEIVKRYEPEVLWFDWWINTKEFQPYLQRLAAFYYNDAARRNSTAVINYKFTAYPDRAAVLDIERGQLDASRALFWQTDTSVSIKSWGYIDNDTFRSPESLIQQLIDIISKNGCLLLNIGPKPDGTIPEQAQQILLAMGRWLSVNGEAIYGTRPWKVYGEGPTKVVGGSFQDTATQPYSSQDIRFTSKGKTLYAIALAWPENGQLTIKSLAQGSPSGHVDVKTIQLLGSNTPIKWTRDGGGLHLALPAQKTGEYAYVFKLSPG